MRVMPFVIPFGLYAQKSLEITNNNIVLTTISIAMGGNVIKKRLANTVNVIESLRLRNEGFVYKEGNRFDIMKCQIVEIRNSQILKFQDLLTHYHAAQYT